jgi:hypothetical protein
MNDNRMNDSTLTELKIVVERAVRPVRATFNRKRRMREELLAHLVATFEEEAGKLGDEQAALRQVKQRFGDPNELTSELQQAVPRWNRWRSLLEHMGCQPGESAWDLAAKHFMVALVIYSTALLLWLVAMWRLGHLPDVGPDVLHFVVTAVVLGLPVVALMNVVLSVVLALMLDRIGPVLVVKRWGRVSLAVLCGFVMLCGFMVPGLVGAAVLFVSMAYQAVKQWRYQADWA